MQPAPESPRPSLKRWQVITVALMVLGYSGCYLCRSNFSVALTSIADELVAAGYQPDEARILLGQIASRGVLAYMFGKFITGSIADFLGGRRNMLAGMLGSVLFTALFACGATLPIFTLAWIGNRAVQSLCWTGMVKITGRWFSYSAYGAAMGIISLSYLFGDAAARWFMGWLFEAGLEWRGVFFVAAGVLLAMSVCNWLWLRETPREIGAAEPAANPLNVYEQAHIGDDQPRDLKGLLLPLVTSPEFIVVCLLSLGLTLLRETFNIWTPTYFSDAIKLSRAQAAAQSAWFPLLGGASVIVAGWLGDRLGPRGRSYVILAGCMLAAAVMWVLGSIDFSGSRLAPVALVALVGFLILGPYSYLAGAISLDLGGKQGGATACGIIDGVGYLGAYLAGDSVARLSSAYGWGGAFQALAAVAALTSLAAALFVVIQRRKMI